MSLEKWRDDEHPIDPPPERTILPVADAAQVRRYARDLLRRRRGPLMATIGLYSLEALAGLATPALFGQIIEAVAQGTTVGVIDRLALAIAGFLVAQAVLYRFATLASARLGEGVLAELREDFVAKALRLPLSILERAGTGDLVSRSSRDVGMLAESARWAVPSVLVAGVTAILTIGALMLVSPLLALPLLLVVPILWYSTRWYLRRAPQGYLSQNAAWADVTDGMTETVEGARTVEALRLGERRRLRTDGDIAREWAAEKYTLRLRTIWYPIVDAGYMIPVALTLLAGGLFYQRGWVNLGQVAAATLYVRQLMGPIDELLSWLDELQVGSASLARLLGVAQVPADRSSTDAQPGNETLVAQDVHYAYAPGKDVLHGVSLKVEQGERLAIVGPSGAGKSTLGRLVAGIHAPTEGTVAVGGVPLVDLPVDSLRRQVALVSQEHHVFLGTLRENVALAKPDATDEEIEQALSAVDALEWVQALPNGLDTLVGSGGVALPPAQSQQLALARLVLADPHTLVLDEATSLIDPQAARNLERSLAAVLEGRTVIAIAHRLYTAHDADRVAVVEDGRIAELGSHEELVRAGGSYAQLWDSWHGR